MEYVLDEKYKGLKKTKPIKYVIKNSCWECISHAVDFQGYIRIVRNNKPNLMHRYIYQMYHNEIPKGMVVMHKCDNRKCVNPEHLSIGTYKDNTQDMHNKNRHKGMTGKKKLSDEQFILIKKYLSEGKPMKELAILCNVSYSTIQKLIYNTK